MISTPSGELLNVRSTALSIILAITVNYGIGNGFAHCHIYPESRVITNAGTVDEFRHNGCGRGNRLNMARQT